ncbi:MAG: DUF4861 family protein, partial [Opitutales bacterium]
VYPCIRFVTLSLIGVVASAVGFAESGEPSAFARFVPERSDDFAWENDKIAFRAYGPALRGKAENSGFDCWLKRVDYPIINKWYKEDKEGKSYHKDHGEGYDPYKVGSSRGCGGLGLWIDEKMVISNTFVDYRVLKSAGKDAVFVLSYEWTHENDEYKEEKRISIKLGDRMFRAASTFWKNGELAAGLPLAVGITTHEGKAAVSKDVESGWIAGWESIDGYGLGTGVKVAPGRIKSFEFNDSEEKDQGHALFIVKTNTQGKFVYYAGYGWEKAGEIKSVEGWASYLKNFEN